MWNQITTCRFIGMKHKSRKVDPIQELDSNIVNLFKEDYTRGFHLLRISIIHICFTSVDKHKKKKEKDPSL